MLPANCSVLISFTFSASKGKSAAGTANSLTNSYMSPLASSPAIDTPAMIELDAATKSFTPRGGQTFHALRGISLSVRDGDFVAVLGKSGSGKSTLLNLIAGLDRPSLGEVHAAGANLARLSENDLALWRGRNVGVVFQFFQLLPTLTVEENIMLAMDFVGKVPGSKRRSRAQEIIATRRSERPGTKTAVHVIRRTTTARGDCPRARERSADRSGRRTHGQPGFRDCRSGHGIVSSVDRSWQDAAHRDSRRQSRAESASSDPIEGRHHHRRRCERFRAPMNTQWRKIIGDFREHRLQIFLIGLVLTLGTAGVVAALNARAILQREIAKSYASAYSADTVLWFDKVEPSLLDKVRALPRVAAVDARRVAFTRVAGKTGAWFPMQLTVVRDFSNQQIGLVHQHQSDVWPSDDGGILIEQSGRSLLAAAVGEELRIRTPEGGTTTMSVAGFVHDTAVAPSTQDRMIYAYVTRAAAGRLGQSTDLDQLLVRMQDRGDMTDVAQFAEDLSDWLKTSNQPPLRVDTLSNTHPHAALMSTMLRILQAFAAVAFICSAALAIYMLSLWMKREVRQVGIMKTIGARSHQLAWQYLALVAPLLVVTNGLALPIGAWVGTLARQLLQDITQHRCRAMVGAALPFVE